VLGRLIYLLILLLVVLTPLPYGSVEPWSTALWELLILLGLVLWCWRQALEGHSWVPRQPLLLPLIALLLVGLFQVLPLDSLGPLATFWQGEIPTDTISHQPSATFQALLKLFASTAFLLLVSEVVTTPRRRDLLVRALLLVCVGIALVGIGQNFIGKVVWQRGAFGPFVNRNHFAGFLVMGAGLFGGLLLGRSTRREWLALYGSGLLLLSAGVVLSASRGGLIALGSTLLFLAFVAVPLLFQRRGGRGGRILRSAGVLGLGATAIVTALLVVGSEGLVQNLAQTGSELEAVQSAEERFSRREIWQATGRLVRDYPWFGVGLGAFPYVYPRYDPSAGTQRVEQTHNDYLQVLADTGIVGGGIAILFVALLFVRGMALAQTTDQRHRSIVLGALAGCFAMAVHSIVDFNLQVTVNAQLALILAALATMRDPLVANREERRRPAGRLSLPPSRKASPGVRARHQLPPGSSVES
jgi:O-antigen ligase